HFADMRAFRGNSHFPLNSCFVKPIWTALQRGCAIWTNSATRRTSLAERITVKCVVRSGYAGTPCACRSGGHCDALDTTPSPRAALQPTRHANGSPAGIILPARSFKHCARASLVSDWRKTRWLLGTAGSSWAYAAPLLGVHTWITLVTPPPG